MGGLIGYIYNVYNGRMGRDLSPVFANIAMMAPIRKLVIIISTIIIQIYKFFNRAYTFMYIEWKGV